MLRQKTLCNQLDLFGKSNFIMLLFSSLKKNMVNICLSFWPGLKIVPKRNHWLTSSTPVKIDAGIHLKLQLVKGLSDGLARISVSSKFTFQICNCSKPSGTVLIPVPSTRALLQHSGSTLIP